MTRVAFLTSDRLLTGVIIILLDAYKKIPALLYITGMLTAVIFSLFQVYTFLEYLQIL